MHRLARPIGVACVGAALSLGAQVPQPLAASRQLVVVTTPGWASTSGSLQSFERSSARGNWRPAGPPISIVVGRTGLAWGTGFDQFAAEPSAPHKHEGDGKSPAGAFPLDTAFGFAPRDSMPPLGLPYVQLTPASECVDDTASVHYNTVVSKTGLPRVDWSSAEHMRSIMAYRFGVIVGYNAAPPMKGRGSCIFLHIWGGPTSTTVGCTAMDSGRLETLMEWLDRSKGPVLVQLTRSDYDRLRVRWSLPRIGTGAPARSHAPGKSGHHGRNFRA